MSHLENSTFRGIEFMGNGDDRTFLYFIIIMLVCVIVIINKSHQDKMASLMSEKVKVI